MGQAKLRGTREQRVIEGTLKKWERQQAAKRRHEAYLKSLTPKQKEAIDTLRTFAAFTGVQL